MKAALNAPSANMARKWLGSRKATKKASATGPAPRTAARMMSRAKPVARERSVKPPTVKIRSIIRESPCRKALIQPIDTGARRNDSDSQIRGTALRQFFAGTKIPYQPPQSPPMASPIIPILLAGGAGTRLWPVSRDALPKQFLPLIGDKSTYQETLLRVRDAMFAPPIVITGPNFHFFARRQAEEIGVDATIVIEPMRRDSGPAIAAATAVASRRDPKAVVLALAADHIIPDVEAFRATCRAGCIAAEAGRIVTFGIKPTEPKTSYGYILPGE